MKKGYFRTILAAQFEKFENESVFQIALNYLKTLAPVYGNILIKAGNLKIKELKALSEKEVVAQYKYLRFEIDEIEDIFKSNFPHQKIVSLKIGESDELYDYHQFLELGSVKNYPEFSSFFVFVDGLKVNFTDKQLLEDGNQNEYFTLMREYLRAPDEEDFKLAKEGEACATNRELRKKLFILLGCFGILKELLKKYKIREQELILKNPSLISIKTGKNDSEENSYINIQEKALNKIPDEWKNRKIADYFSFLFKREYSAEMAYYEKKASLAIKALEFDVKQFSDIEKKHSIEKRITEIKEELFLAKNKAVWDYFNTTVMEYFSKYQDQVNLAISAQKVDPLFLDDRDEKIDKTFLTQSKLIEEAFDDLEPNQYSKIIDPINLGEGKSYLKTLPNLAKSVINPKVNHFLEVKLLVEQKQFLEKCFKAPSVEDSLSSNQDLDGGSKPIEWYKDNISFTIPEGANKIDLNMTPRQERKFFSLFCLETNKSGKTFLSIKDAGEIFENGFTIPNIPPKKFYSLDLEGNRRSKKIVCICFYRLFINQKEMIDQIVKEELALFLKYYFLEFKDMEVQAIKQLMRDYKNPANVHLDIANYLPKY